MNSLHPRFHRERNGAKAALVMIDSGEMLTYDQLVGGSNRLAQWMNSLGIEEGDTVAFFMENQTLYPQLCWAAENSGLFYVCVSRSSSASEAAYVVSNSGAKLLVISNAVLDVGLATSKLLGPDVRLFMCGGEVSPFRSVEAAIINMPDRPIDGRHRGEVMMYSSGTTGVPKGIKHPTTQESPDTAPPRHLMFEREYGLSEESVILNPGPLYHSTPLKFMMHGQRAGATVLCMKKFDAVLALRAIETYRATIAVLVPTMMVRFLKLSKAERDAVDTSSLEVLLHQAAPCPVEVKSAIIEWMGPICFDLYGGSEANGAVTINSHDWLQHKGSVGKPVAGTEVHILDDQLQECAPYKQGLIYLWNGHTFEYHGDPQKTAEARNEKGWSTLGDIGYLDAEGYLYLTDRKSHVIISGGVNIYPAEVENVLVLHPMILDVAIVGVPNEDLGEEVKAVIVVQPGAVTVAPEELERQLISYCRERLNAVKCPRSVDFIEALPRSEAGKVLKRELRLRYWPATTLTS